MTMPGRVLVVEDDAALRDTLAEVLADDGHEVRVATDGEAALTLLQAWVPDLIVLDLMMPRMDGYAFREGQRAVTGTATTKVLLLSAAREVAAAAAELRADAWLVKPFGLNDVLRSVDELINGAA